MLTDSVYQSDKVRAYLQAAGLKPGLYNTDIAYIAWATAVPDAARNGRLRNLIDRVVEDDSAFGRELERRLQPLLAPSGGECAWYHHDNPYECDFVGPRASRAVIDRAGLRRGLRELATDEYWILVVSGKARSGKSHSWVLIDHLRNAGKLTGVHRFVRVTTHTWSGEVTGEDLTQSLIAKLGLNIGLTPSGELEDARIRKLLDMLVGQYPQGDDVTRWIILDGLDRPGVQNSARDVAKRLITLVDEGELPKTRLIVTGLDPLGLTVAHTVRFEEIPSINKALLRSFFEDVAAHLGRTVADEELNACVDEVLGTGEPLPDLHDVEEAVVQTVKKCWVDGARNGD
ncbi:MAG TPA: hypothetical protein VKA15_24545 [Isosphaeraceae bacterium]|nr:hypothetical protein [Isosphaeraceae bacterium]